jgi:hypothetical protein
MITGLYPVEQTRAGGMDKSRDSSSPQDSGCSSGSRNVTIGTLAIDVTQQHSVETYIPQYAKC